MLSGREVSHTGTGIAKTRAVRQAIERYCPCVDSSALLQTLTAHSSDSPQSHIGKTTIERDYSSANVLDCIDVSATRAFIRQSRRLLSHNESTLDEAAFWRHSLTVAVAAQLIGGLRGLDEFSNALFSAGLTHDFGHLVLAGCFPRSYNRAVHRIFRENEPVTEVETELVGVDHCTAGRLLLRNWNADPLLQYAAWLHHNWPQSTITDANLEADIKTVILAHAVAGNAKTELCSGSSIGVMERSCEDLKVPIERIRKLTRQLPGIVAEVDDKLDLARILHEDNSNIVRTMAPVSAIPPFPDDTSRTSSESPLATAIAGLARSGGDRPTVMNACLRIASSVINAFGIGRVGVFAMHKESGILVAATPTGNNIERLTQRRDCLGPADTFAADWAISESCSSTAIEPILERVTCLLEMVDPFPIHFVSGGDLSAGMILDNADPAANGYVALYNWEKQAFLTVAAAEVTHAQHTDNLEQQLELFAANCRKTSDDQGSKVQQASLGMIAEMAAGAAHELNNPLAVISGRAQMLKADLVDPQLSRQVAIIDEQARLASAIISELMSFAKPPVASRSQINVRQWINRLRQYWQEHSTIRSDQICATISDPTLAVFADAEQLTEAAVAIISNSIEASSPQKLRVLINSDSSASDDTVVVSFEDNGCGMAPDVLKHACDPFFSYRPAGRGRGLGLSRAARLLENNGGKLWMQSTVGAGTKVFLTLPTRPPRA